MNELPSTTGSPSVEVVAARPVSSGPPAGAMRPLELSGVSRAGAALDLALLLFVALLIPLGLDVMVATTLPQMPDRSFDPRLVIPKQWLDALLLVVVAAYFVYRHRLPAAAFGMQAERIGYQMLWSLGTLGAVYVVFAGLMVVVAALVLLYPGLEQDLTRRVEFLKLLPLDNLTATVLLLIPVAIHEELLFRGLLIPYLHRLGCSWAVGVALSSAIFALLHIAQGWLGILQIFGVGLAVGTFFVLSRSLLAVMVAHFLFDFCQMQLVRFLLPWMERAAENA